MVKELIEELADLEHRQWTHWTRYMLDNLTDENLERWKIQCQTDYKDLTEKEKDSDRVWANKVIKTMTLHNWGTVFKPKGNNGK